MLAADLLSGAGAYDQLVSNFSFIVLDLGCNFFLVRGVAIAYYG